VSDGWMKARTKGQHRESDHHEEGPRVTALPGVQQQVPPPVGPGPAPEPQPVVGDVQQAMQMLTLAQRTADEHVATAHRHAEKIQTDARASAEQIVRDAQAQADAVRREADQALAEARAQVEQAAKDVKAQAASAQRDGEKIVADAQARAAEITEEARTTADGLERRAKQRYEEEVGALATKREALQQQIESLQEFDREYRSRLLTFMQAQLRALWAESPQVADAELPVPAPRDGTAAGNGAGGPAGNGAGGPAGSAAEPAPAAAG
jgi:cell division septum initiation protein DivIVA